MDREFAIIKEYFDKFDMRLIKKKGLSVFKTEYGLYGSSGLPDVFALFKQLSLQNFSRFVDLGSGDGRVAIVAALFTRSVGIEGDPELHELAQQALKDLGEDVPQLKRCTLKNGDYTEEDLSGFDFLFIYCDHNWPEPFQEKLERECNGLLISHHNIYEPRKLKKGKTYWVEQVPFVSYPLNR